MTTSYTSSLRFAIALVVVVMETLLIRQGQASVDERALIEHLFQSKNYNPLIRPVQNLSDQKVVGFEIALIQIINLDERNQVMKSNLWLRVEWDDYQLKWTGEDFGDISVLRIKPSRVWTPDIVLFNNADGKFEVQFQSNVLIYDSGYVMWVPCTIYKSSCTINVEYFPFDEQTCTLMFGSWTYSEDEVILRPYTDRFEKVDLTDYEKSGTWDVYDVPSRIVSYDAKTGRNTSRAYYDVRLRRKTLFYTVNLIIPSVLISCLSMVTFYLPTTAGEKVTMSVSILLALVVFLQVLVTSLLPPSSNSLPLFAKYLLFTILMDICCIVNTVISLNWTFKTPRTHRMPKWVRIVFIDYLPRLLLLRRSGDFQQSEQVTAEPITPNTGRRLKPQELDLTEVHHVSCPYSRMSVRQRRRALDASTPRIPAETNKAIEAVRFVSAHIKNEDDFTEVLDDWRYVSLVMDRFLMYIYMIVTIVATCSILIRTPIFEFFDQKAFKDAVAHERDCKEDVSYRAECNDWYKVLCVDEHNNLHPFIIANPGYYFRGACEEYMGISTNQ